MTFDRFMSKLFDSIFMRIYNISMRFYYFMLYLLIFTSCDNDMLINTNYTKDINEMNCYIKDSDYDTICGCDSGCKCGSNDYLIEKGYSCLNLPQQCNTEQNLVLLKYGIECPCKTGNITCTCDSGMSYNYNMKICVCNAYFKKSDDGRCKCEFSNGCQCSNDMYIEEGATCPKFDGECDYDKEYEFINNCPCKKNGKCVCGNRHDNCQCGNNIGIYETGVCPYGDSNDLTCENDVYLYDSNTHCPCKKGSSLCYCFVSDGCECSNGIKVNYLNFCPGNNGQCQNDIFLDNKEVECPCTNKEKCKYKCSEGIYTDLYTECPNKNTCEIKKIYHITDSEVECPCLDGGKCYCDSHKMCKCNDNIIVKKGGLCPYISSKTIICENNIKIIDTNTECPCSIKDKCKCDYGMEYNINNNKCECIDGFIKDKNNRCECSYADGCKCGNEIRIKKGTTCPHYNGICDVNEEYFITNNHTKCPCKIGKCLCENDNKINYEETCEKTNFDETLSFLEEESEVLPDNHYDCILENKNENSSIYYTSSKSLEKSIYYLEIINFDIINENIFRNFGTWNLYLKYYENSNVNKYNFIKALCPVKNDKKSEEKAFELNNKWIKGKCLNIQENLKLSNDQYTYIERKIDNIIESFEYLLKKDISIGNRNCPDRLLNIEIIKENQNNLITPSILVLLTLLILI